jgi:ribonuclease P protein component
LARAIFFKHIFISRQFTLGKNERLKSRKLIEQLFRQGKSFAAFPFRVYYMHQPETLTAQYPSFSIQFGIGVSSKNFKKAVERNRIKRLARESYRLQKQSLHELLNEKKEQLAIFFIYTGKELPEHIQIKEKIGLILQRLIHIVHENSAPNT